MVKTGVDKLEVSLSLNIENHGILNRLENLKKIVQETIAPCILVDFDRHKVFKWNLQRAGTRLYPYVLRSGDITLLLSTRDGESPIPNCRIEIGSVSSQENAFGIYQDLVEWLEFYGLKRIDEVVSRVDLAADAIGTEIDGLKVSDKNRWISRARKFVVYYEDWDITGIMLGKGSLALRVYEKSIELQKNKEKAKFFYDLWQCKEGTPVTRVEFQLRREVLKEFATPMNTVAELSQNIDAVWQYCVNDWARFASRSVDRKNDNQNREESSSFWKKIQKAIFNLRQPGTHRIKSNLHKNLAALRKQARGCLLNFAAAAGHSADDFYGIMGTIQDVIQEEFSNYMTHKYDEFAKLFRIRRNEVYIGF